MKWPVLESFGTLSSPNKAWFCWHFLKSYSFIRRTQCLKNFSKFWVFPQKERTQSLQFWSIFERCLPPANQKYWPKPKFLQEPPYFQVSQKLHYSDKIGKKSHFWLLKWSKLTPSTGPKVQQKSWRRSIPYRNQSIDCRSRLYLSDTPSFLLHRAFFLEGRGKVLDNNSGKKNVRLS